MPSKFTPFASFEYVDVTFGTANTAHIIPHSLSGPTEGIRWIPVSIEGNGTIYRDNAIGRQAWGSDYIVLRSSLANQVCRLLLTVEQSS